MKPWPDNILSHDKTIECVLFFSGVVSTCTDTTHGVITIEWREEYNLFDVAGSRGLLSTARRIACTRKEITQYIPIYIQGPIYISVSRQELELSTQSFKNPKYFKRFFKTQIYFFHCKFLFVSMGCGGVLSPKGSGLHQTPCWLNCSLYCIPGLWKLSVLSSSSCLETKIKIGPWSEIKYLKL